MEFFESKVNNNTLVLVCGHISPSIRFEINLLIGLNLFF